MLLKECDATIYECEYKSPISCFCRLNDDERQDCCPRNSVFHLIGENKNDK